MVVWGGVVHWPFDFLASSAASCLVLFYRLIALRLSFWCFVTASGLLSPSLYPSASLFSGSHLGRLLPPMGLALLWGWVWVVLRLLGVPSTPLLFAAAASADYELLPVATCFCLALHPSSSLGSLFSLLYVF